ncbi:MAG: right-handed parallel beta-helix repeat-containing protein [Chitinivibrionia bacterium]|nr:right-handed parallel beta-helix repeat-containing protein [Chitinivibrionia bacterium]
MQLSKNIGMFRNLTVIFILFAMATTAFAQERIYVSPARQGKSPISNAMVSARAGDTIILADGRYVEDVVVQNGVILYSPNVFGAHIIGNGREAVVRLGRDSRISGVRVSGGRNGIVSSATGAVIENCYIHSNNGSGILSTNHLPAIQNTIIANNLNSGIQATSISYVGGELRNLTIAQNRRNGIEIDGLRDNIVIRDVIFYRNSNRAIQTRDRENLNLVNLIIFPEQGGITNPDPTLIGRPRFTGNFWKLRDGSIGQKRGTSGKDIGFVK